MAALCLLCLLAAASTRGGAYAMVEIRFELAPAGNPFDPAENDVRVALQDPKGAAVDLPAFFDGERAWRARFTPAVPGRYRVTRVARNGAEVKGEGLTPQEFTAAGTPGRGFVRRDPGDSARFRFDDGPVYYPLGHNCAWKDGRRDMPALFREMGQAGENWSRVWMNHWDGKNLDWPGTGKPGELDLAAARRWDGILRAAEQHGLYLQVVLQHHGQYSTRVNPNWNESPWSRKNGGFLATPEAFFTDARARALTKAKYRYVVARWGYSPHVLAWELFNEVQFTDAVANGQAEAVLSWHGEMAAFLRAQDPNRHLITTSSATDIPGLYDAMDFVQPHAYPSDPVAAARELSPAAWGRPVFFGEFGPAGDLNGDDGRFLNSSLWASVMSSASGAAQYWNWSLVDGRDLYPLFRSAASFVTATTPEFLTTLRPAELPVETAELGRVSFGPGGEWGAAKQTEFTVSPSGAVEGAGAMPAYLQGNAHWEMFPAATFHVEFRRPGRCVVTVQESARAGARVLLRVDGKVAAERDFPAAAKHTRVNTTLEAPIPVGKHALRLENTGADWVRLGQLTFEPYGPAWRAIGKTSATGAAFWAFRSAASAPAGGDRGPVMVAVPGLEAGAYRITWWNIPVGQALPVETATAAAGQPLRLRLPATGGDIAAFVVRTGGV